MPLWLWKHVRFMFRASDMHRRTTVPGNMPPQMMRRWLIPQQERLCVCKRPLGLRVSCTQVPSSTHLPASFFHFLTPFSLLSTVSYISPATKDSQVNPCLQTCFEQSLSKAVRVSPNCPQTGPVYQVPLCEGVSGLISRVLFVGVLSIPPRLHAATSHHG